MKWGTHQKICHNLLLEAFDSKGQAYYWLYEKFQVRHFSELDPLKDKILLAEINSQLLSRSISKLAKYK